MNKACRLGILAVFGASSAMAIYISHASAQEAATQLEPITVEGDGKQDPKAPVKGFVAKTSSTATKTGTPLVETQQSISVITADQLKAQGAETVGEALDYVPGVVGEPFGADPRFDSPKIRGFDGRQSQYLNGLRMMRTAGAPSVDPYALERIEVLRGPASVMYGQGNPGGLINLISKRPLFEKFGEVGLQVGSYDTYGTYFDFGGPVSEGSNFAYRLTGLVRDAGAQTDYLDNDRYLIAPALTWQPDDDTKLTILTSVQRDNPSTPSGLPPELTLNSTGNRLSRNFYVGDPDFDKSKRTLTNLGYEFEHRFNDTWTFRQNARYTNLDWNYQALGMASIGTSTGGLAPDGRTIRRSATFQDELLNAVNIDNNLQAEFSTGGIDHTVLMGLDYRYFDNNVTTEFWRSTPLDAINPVYGQPITLSLRTLYTKVDSDLTQVGVYAQDEVKAGNWRATFGLRQDWASTEGGSTNAVGFTRPLNKDDHKLTGRAGIGYLFDNGIAPYVSYSTSFEPVPVPASGNLLEPTTGEQIEVGVKYSPQDWNGYFAAALYDLKQKNVLTTVTQNGNPVSGQIGVDVKGLELEAVANLSDRLNLRGAYTYMDAKIVEGPGNNIVPNSTGKRPDNVGNRPDNVPEHSASLWLDYTFDQNTALDGFSVGGGVRFVGQRYGDIGNIYDLDPVTLLDASIRYKKGNLKASLNLQNLADENYVASCSSFGCTYGDGRTITGMVAVTW